MGGRVWSHFGVTTRVSLGATTAVLLLATPGMLAVLAADQHHTTTSSLKPSHNSTFTRTKHQHTQGWLTEAPGGVDTVLSQNDSDHLSAAGTFLMNYYRQPHQNLQQDSDTDNPDHTSHLLSTHDASLDSQTSRHDLTGFKLFKEYADAQPFSSESQKMHLVSTRNKHTNIRPKRTANHEWNQFGGPIVHNNPENQPSTAQADETLGSRLPDNDRSSLSQFQESGSSMTGKQVYMSHPGESNSFTNEGEENRESPYNPLEKQKIVTLKDLQRPSSYSVINPHDKNGLVKKSTLPGTNFQPVPKHPQLYGPHNYRYPTPVPTGYVAPVHEYYIPPPPSPPPTEAEHTYLATSYLPPSTPKPDINPLGIIKNYLQYIISNNVTDHNTQQDEEYLQPLYQPQPAAPPSSSHSYFDGDEAYIPAFDNPDLTFSQSTGSTATGSTLSALSSASSSSSSSSSSPSSSPTTSSGCFASTFCMFGFATLLSSIAALAFYVPFLGKRRRRGIDDDWSKYTSLYHNLLERINFTNVNPQYTMNNISESDSNELALGSTEGLMTNINYSNGFLNELTELIYQLLHNDSVTTMKSIMHLIAKFRHSYFVDAMGRQ